MLRQLNMFVKWFHGTSNETLRLTVLGVTRNVKENEMRHALRFASTACVFLGAFYVSHKGPVQNIWDIIHMYVVLVDETKTENEFWQQ